MECTSLLIQLAVCLSGPTHAGWQGQGRSFVMYAGMPVPGLKGRGDAAPVGVGGGSVLVCWLLRACAVVAWLAAHIGVSGSKPEPDSVCAFANVLNPPSVSLTDCMATFMKSTNATPFMSICSCPAKGRGTNHARRKPKHNNNYYLTIRSNRIFALQSAPAHRHNNKTCSVRRAGLGPRKSVRLRKHKDSHKPSTPAVADTCSSYLSVDRRPCSSSTVCRPARPLQPAVRAFVAAGL